MNRQAATGRVLVVDIARFYGLVLVYYGHIVERFMNLGSAPAEYQYKFIYSFHMVLFFLLAGYISKYDTLPVGKFVKRTLFCRVMPLAFFNALNIVITLFVPQAVFYHLADTGSFSGYMWGIVRTICGFPVFDVVTWFFYMLISVEIIHYIVFRYLKTNTAIMITALAFYLGGYFLNLKVSFFRPDKILWNFWFMHEAITMYAFYLFGIYLSRWKGLEIKRSWFVRTALVVSSIAFVYFTYNLNKGPFLPHTNAVIIAAGSHGNIFLFPVTAIVGCLFCFFLANITPLNKYVLLIGQNATIVFPMNGIFYTFINGRIAEWAYANLSHQPLVISAVCGAVTVVSLALCVPCVHFFNAYVPQLVGKPKIKGPIFNSFYKERAGAEVLS